jgi:type I restriction enzyme S subunit
MKNNWSSIRLSDVLKPVSRRISVHPTEEYQLLGIRLDGGGIFHRETKPGSQISATTLFRVKAGDFIYSRLFAWRGAFGVINTHLDGYCVSGEFPTFTPIAEKIDITYLQLWFRLPKTIEIVEADCTGSTPLTRNRFKENFILVM